MNKVKCEKCSQFYNADRYTDGCPHCKKISETSVTEKIQAKEKPYAQQVDADPQSEPVFVDPSTGTPDSSDLQSEPVFIDPPVGMSATPDSSLNSQVRRLSSSSGEKTESFFNKRITPQEKPAEIRVEPRTASADDDTQDAPPVSTVSNENIKQVRIPEPEEGKTQSFFQQPGMNRLIGKQPTPSNQENTYAMPYQTGFPSHGTSLNATRCEKCGQYYNVNRFPDGCPYCKGKQNGGTHTEVTYVMPRKVTEPNVGWLVCIKGERFGECFELFAGKNSIGRNPSNRVAIVGDPGVSREQHAFVLYEPKSRKFYLQPGNSSGLTYKNEELVLSPVPLQDRDKIGLNESVFMFVALCSESFSWDAIES